jgi:hypothetical protein
MSNSDSHDTTAVRGRLTLPTGARTRTPARAEVTVKFHETPAAREDRDGITLELECDGWVIAATLKPKAWRKALLAMEQYPQWVAAISGKLGARTSQGFTLAEVGIQVFEKKPKAAAIEQESGR